MADLLAALKREVVRTRTRWGSSPSAERATLCPYNRVSPAAQRGVSSRATRPRPQARLSHTDTRISVDRSATS
eukprot:6214203-Pleurochrysis_carterae.AAC.1